MVNPESHYSSQSELESTYSDSDWLDIPSSHVSEDNDSVAGFDDYSDREGIDRPSSRRSFSSAASSRGGAVEGWEGLIEDSADEASPEDHDAFVDPITSAEISLDDLNHASAAQDDHEDERVKAGLEQSMMSTLSSSRSNSLSGSMQTSIVRSTRDLRLSFPDPLTSSQEELFNTSYEDLTTSHTQEPLTEAEFENDSSSIGDAADPGLVSTPVVPVTIVPSKPRNDIPSGITPDLCIILYGLSGLSKASLVNCILDKWAYSAGLRRACSLTHAPGVTTQVFVTKESVDEHSYTRRYVSILDKTGDQPKDNSAKFTQLTCPSLAIIFLPSPDFILPEHSLYLPIVGSSPFSTVDVYATSDYLLDAEQQWESFGIPAVKLTSLSDWSSPVVDEEKLEKASTDHVYQVLHALVSPSTKKARPALRAQTIMLAILSIVLGYVVHGTFQPSPIVIPQIYDYNASRTVDPPPAIELGIERHRGSSLITTSAAIVAISTSSSKPADVAVFSPFTTIASTSATVIAVPAASGSSLGADHMDLMSGAPTECDCGCGMVTWPGKTASTDLVLRPSTPAPALITDARSNGVLGFIGSSRGNGKGKGKAITSVTDQDTSLYALSIRIAGSITEYLDFRTVTKAVRKDTQKDLQELLDALDRLAEVISRQTATLWKQSIGTVSLLREEVNNRNSHARERARQLKDMGERLLGTVGEKFKARSEIAREKAQTIRSRLVKSELSETIKKVKRDAMEGSKARRIKRKEKRQLKAVWSEKRSRRAVAH
ncbi:hypothetical protein QCA50_005797 [Cerrena zonata]|uniref:Uncharacterized protein n=1 Tax=Cerrena zonata TaxID=2478898 RepID=A0AAW0GAV4_9APHY